MRSLQWLGVLVPIDICTSLNRVNLERYVVSQVIQSMPEALSTQPSNVNQD